MVRPQAHSDDLRAAGRLIWRRACEPTGAMLLLLVLACGLFTWRGISVQRGLLPLLLLLLLQVLAQGLHVPGLHVRYGRALLVGRQRGQDPVPRLLLRLAEALNGAVLQVRGAAEALIGNKL